MNGNLDLNRLIDLLKKAELQKRLEKLTPEQLESEKTKERIVTQIFSDILTQKHLMELQESDLWPMILAQRLVLILNALEVKKDEIKDLVLDVVSKELQKVEGKEISKKFEELKIPANFTKVLSEILVDKEKSKESLISYITKELEEKVMEYIKKGEDMPESEARQILQKYSEAVKEILGKYGNVKVIYEDGVLKEVKIPKVNPITGLPEIDPNTNQPKTIKVYQIDPSKIKIESDNKILEKINEQYYNQLRKEYEELGLQDILKWFEERGLLENPKNLFVKYSNLKD